MEKENHPVVDLERYDPSPLQFDGTAGVINIPTLTMCEEAMETTVTACDSNCLVNSSFYSSRASTCGCFKTGYFDARLHDYDKNDAIRGGSSADKINENSKSLTTMIVDDCSQEIEREIEEMEESGMSAGMSAATSTVKSTAVGPATSAVTESKARYET